jgi:hypothetical protein
MMRTNGKDFAQNIAFQTSTREKAKESQLERKWR